MDAHEFYREYENLKESRVSELWNDFSNIVFADTERYEDFILDLEEIALDYGLGRAGDDTESYARAVFETLKEHPDVTGLAYEVLDIAMDLEQDDYFGTEGLRL